MTTRPGLAQLGLSAGKKARLHRILYQYGQRNGTALFLPYDQGLEHGPRDFFENPAASDPAYIIRLALEGGFNGIAIQIGLAEKFYWNYAGEIPLVLKLNGKTDIPSADAPLSPVNATVADAVRLGADAVGYTLYVGTELQDRDFEQYRQVRAEARRLGMPLIVWSYPRGSAIDAKGGKDSFYAVDYAARTASELGADVVKVNFPQPRQAGPRSRALPGLLLLPGSHRRRGPVREPDPAAGVRGRAGRGRRHAGQGPGVDGGGRGRPDLRAQRLAA